MVDSNKKFFNKKIISFFKEIMFNNNNKKFIKKNNLFILITILVILIDQLTKFLFIKTGNISIFSFFDIALVQNTGASFGIMKDKTIVLSIISLAVIGFILYLKKSLKKNKEVTISLALILGGTIGNLIDRIFRKFIVDFLYIHFSWLNYPAFNIADSCIVIGTGLIIIAFIRKKA